MIRRTLVAAAVVVGMVAGTGTPAVAKVTATPGYSYISSYNDCAWTQAWLSDEWGGRIRLESVGTMDYYDGSPCGNNTFVQAPYGIAVQQNLMVWRNERWEICPTSPPWVYNTGWAHEVWTGFTWTDYTLPCGYAFYRSWSQAMSYDNGWHSDIAILGNDWVLVD